MATPKPGEIRCPTCHRSTPPATFCTQCGSAIPADARIRPRGLDRDELQERIRARRSGSEPYRRGVGGDGGYERFEPEPEDQAAVRRGEEAPRPDVFDEGPPRQRVPAAIAAASYSPPEPVTRPDITRDRDDWAPPPAVEAEPPEPPAPRAPYLAPVEDYGHRDADDGYVEYAEDPAYGADYTEWEEEPRERRSAGAGALAILGFLALGVLALLGGAVLAGVFNGDPPTGQVETSPSPTASSGAVATESEPAETATPSPSADPDASDAPRESGDPIVFPDGFTAEVQPCLPGTADVDGCDSNGATNGGTVDIWVGFRQGTGEDVISAQVIGPDGSPTDAGTLSLARIGCRQSCPAGWTYFPIGNLPDGTYEVRVTRNGEPAGETSFVVS
jgi:hypothetical protein